MAQPMSECRPIRDANSSKCWPRGVKPRAWSPTRARRTFPQCGSSGTTSCARSRLGWPATIHSLQHNKKQPPSLPARRLKPRSCCVTRSGLVCGIDLNLRHHAAILVVEDVTVIDEGSRNVGIPEIHPYSNAGVWSRPCPVRDDHGVLQLGIRHRYAVDGFHQEVDLVDVEGVHLAGVINDSPIFDVSGVGHDRRRIVHVEEVRYLALYRNVELRAAVGAHVLLREVQLPSDVWSQIRQIGEAYGLGRGLHRVLCLLYLVLLLR